MNKKADNTYREAKEQLDYVFIIVLVASQAVRKVGTVDDISEMYITGAWSSLYMNTNWLARIYDKGALDESKEVDLSIDLTDDRAENLEKITEYLDMALDALEETNFESLWNNGKPPKLFDLMLGNVYTGIFESQAMLEMELNRYEAAEDPTTNENGEADAETK